MYQEKELVEMGLVHFLGLKKRKEPATSRLDKRKNFEPFELLHLPHTKTEWLLYVEEFKKNWRDPYNPPWIRCRGTVNSHAVDESKRLKDKENKEIFSKGEIVFVEKIQPGTEVPAEHVGWLRPSNMDKVYKYYIVYLGKRYKVTTREHQVFQKENVGHARGSDHPGYSIYRWNVVCGVYNKEQITDVTQLK